MKASDQDVRREGWWALARLVLGVAQMIGAVASVTLLLSDGVNTTSLAAVVLTCILTTTSVLLFGSRRAKR